MTFTLHDKDATCDQCGNQIAGGGTDWRPRSAHLCFSSSRTINTTKETA